jgi:5'-3' exonuclease
MEDIRRKYANNEYSYDTRHCIYSRVPDALLLALTLHTPNVTIIKEMIRGGKHPKQR